jgi:hypothetical protein
MLLRVSCSQLHTQVKAMWVRRVAPRTLNLHVTLNLLAMLMLYLVLTHLMWDSEYATTISGAQSARMRLCIEVDGVLLLGLEYR